MLAAAVTLLLVALALGADIVAPFDAFDPASANIIDARLPPGSTGIDGDFYLLGTDPQGRDMLSAMIYGLRTSLVVGLSSVALAAIVGVLLGLIAGYFGGLLDALIMRIADVQLSFPAILIALLIDGITRTVLDRATHEALAVPILIAAIAASFWVQYARTVRSLVLVERGREYVLAARVTGVSTPRILLSHILPNVLGPVLVIATINLALAILTEATLSFLGVGIPRRSPRSARWCASAMSSSSPATGGSAPARAAAGRAVAVGEPVRRLAARRAEPEARRMSALLEVENLRVEIAARARTMVAIDDVSFSIEEGEILGVVGESGAGKSVTGTAILGLLEKPAFQAGGRILFGGARIDDLGEDAMRALRGREIAAVFQDPLTSLDPLMSIGRQLAETMLTHLDYQPRRGMGAGAAPARRGRHPRSEGAAAELSARAVRRHAPARGAGARLLLRAAAHHRRRADHRARCLDPGAGARPPEAHVPRARHGGDAGDARHGRHRRGRRPGRRHVCRPPRRDRPDHGDIAGGGASL